MGFILPCRLVSSNLLPLIILLTGALDKIYFKSSENIQMKDSGPDSTVLNNQFSSVTLNELAMNIREYYNFEFQRGSQSKD